MNLSQIPRIANPEMLLSCRGGLMRYRDGMVSLTWFTNHSVEIDAYDDRGLLRGRFHLCAITDSLTLRSPQPGDNQYKLQDSLYNAQLRRRNDDVDESLVDTLERFLADMIPGDLLPENRPGEGGQQHAIERLREERDEAGKHARSLNAELGEVNRERDDLADRLVAANRRNKDLTELVDEYQRKFQSGEELRSKLDGATQQIEELERSLEQAEGWRHRALEADQLRDALGAEKDRAANLAQQVADLGDSVDAHVQEHQKDAEELEAERDRLQANLRGASRTIDVLRSHLHSARSERHLAQSSRDKAVATIESVLGRVYELIGQPEPLATLLPGVEDHEREQLRPVLMYVATGQMLKPNGGGSNDHKS